MTNQNYNTNYLLFDAFSVKEALINKLSRETKFTDQLYEDSNLSVLIDCSAYLFQLLTYMINQNTSESIFSESQMYENLNRIVKLIGYNPLGNSPCLVSLKAIQNENMSPKTATIGIIPQFTSIKCNSQDVNGNDIYYSLSENMNISNKLDGETMEFTLANGRWKQYSTIFTSSGINFETFELLDLPVTTSQSSVKKCFSNPYLKVFVKSNLNDSFSEFKVITDSNLLEYKQSVSNELSKVVQIRLNENKKYELKFGNNIYGIKLDGGMQIFVFYIEGNGENAFIKSSDMILDKSASGWQIGPSAIENSTLNINQWKAIVNIDENSLISSKAQLQSMFLNSISFYQEKESTYFGNIETVDTIKSNAPEWFKTQGRLVTKDNFNWFIRNQWGTNLYDVSVFNNWDYMGQFYYWLKKYGFLNPDITSSGYLYADNCDFNNVYVWIKWKSLPISESIIKEALEPIKVLTSEVVVCPTINTFFSVCSDLSSNLKDETLNNGKYNASNGSSEFDPLIRSRIEVIRDSNYFVRPEKLQLLVKETIDNFFTSNNNSFGQRIDLSELYARLLSISGVFKVRMAFLNDGFVKLNEAYENNDIDLYNKLLSNIVYYDGISFAQYTPQMIFSNDLEVIKGSRVIESFQFPILNDSNLLNKITIITDGFNGLT